MRRVLLTGATGFIGQHAIDPLLEDGYDVHALGRGPRPAGISRDVAWQTADLLDGAGVDEVLGLVRPSHLLHLAWYATPPDYWTSLENVRWVEATLRLVRRFADGGGERAVLAGTCAEYDLRHGFCSEEVTPLRPDTLYGASKHSTHLVAAAAAERLGVSLGWGRIFFVYGPAEHPSRLVASVIRALLVDQRADCSHGRQVRDFLHSEDVARGFVALLSSDVEGPVNIGSGIPVSVATVATTIGELLGRPDLVCLGARESPADEPPLVVADVRRLGQEVGWRPRYTLSSGLEQTIGWWRRNSRNG